MGAENLEGKTDKQLKSVDVEISLDKGSYSLVTKRVDEETCNPLKIWHDMGEPANPSKDQVELLQMSAWPQLGSQIVSDGKLNVKLPENAVVYFELKPFTLNSDRGYDYERVMQTK